MSSLQTLSRRRFSWILAASALSSCRRERSVPSAFLNYPSGPVKKNQVVILPVLVKATGIVFKNTMDRTLQEDCLSELSKEISYQFGIRGVDPKGIQTVISNVNSGLPQGEFILLPYRGSGTFFDDRRIKIENSRNTYAAENLIHSLNEILKIESLSLPAELVQIIKEASLKFGASETEEILLKCIGVSSALDNYPPVVTTKLAGMINDPDKYKTLIQSLDAQLGNRYIQQLLHCSHSAFDTLFELEQADAKKIK